MGLLLAAIWTAAWILAVAIATPEPPEDMASFSRPKIPRPVVDSSGITMDLQVCSHCPEFLLLGRGFGSDVSPPPFALLAVSSRPAVWLAKLVAPRVWIPQLNPLAFIGALGVQWVALGLLVRVGLHWTLERQPWRVWRAGAAP